MNANSKVGRQGDRRSNGRRTRPLIERLEAISLFSTSFQLTSVAELPGGNGTILIPAAAASGKQAAANLGEGSAGGSSSGGGAVALSSGQFNIVINANSGLAGNPAALAAFERAAAQWEARITDQVTVNINADLRNLGSTTIIGQTQSVRVQDTYRKIRDAVVADAASDEASDDAIVTKLPTVSQVRYVLPNGSIAGVADNSTSAKDQLSGTKAAFKALGFAAELDSRFGTNDATITFNSGFAFDYDNTDGVPANRMDFETVAVHELGHALGFISNVDNISANQLAAPPTTLDLFRFEFSGSGRNPLDDANFTNFPRSQRKNVEAVTDGISGWLSADAENRMSTVGDGRQASHWKDNDLVPKHVGILDPTLGYGQVWTISDADWRAMDLIGWDISPAPVVVNQPPVAMDDVYSVGEDAVLIAPTVDVPSVLANDTDLDGDTLSVDPVAGFFSAMGATVTVNSDGSFSYDPRGSETLQGLPAGQSANDTFTYTVRDGRGGTDTGTVTVTVNGADEVGAPATPTALSVASTVPASTSRLTLTWADNSSEAAGGEETGFRIRRSTTSTFAAGTFVDIAVSANATAYTDTGLAAGTQYFYKVYAINGGSLSPPSNVASATTATPYFSNGSGLTARYYASTNFTNQKGGDLTDTSGVIENWGTGRPPVKGMPSDNFTVRWTGQLVPSHDETHHLYGKADDNIRVWIDDPTDPAPAKLIIRRWGEANTSEWMSEPLQLVAGRAYNIQVDFRERAGDASVSLSWWSPSLGKQVIPGSRFNKHGTQAPAVYVDPAGEAVNPVGSPGTELEFAL